jgi:hypothetical protein
MVLLFDQLAKVTVRIGVMVLSARNKSCRVAMGPIRPQNLNDVFYAAARQAQQRPPELPHNQKV